MVNRYGADALRLYLINSPVVHAEPLRFEEKGVYDVVKAVFLPWYNAYRFLAQNVVRVRASGGTFDPVATLTAFPPNNVLDRWLQAATRTMVASVRREMDAYHLNRVVPNLLRFIDELTNVYVRLNRGRLKGRSSPEDCAMALSTLFDSLVKACLYLLFSSCCCVCEMGAYCVYHVMLNLLRLIEALPNVCVAQPGCLKGGPSS